MARERGKQSPDQSTPARAPEPFEEGPGDPVPGADGTLGPIPDLVRKALGLGLSGFFFTEEAVRKALGDTLPRDWADFLADQSERTRSEFLERMSYEIGRSIERVDLADVLTRLLEGRTLRIQAEVELGEVEPGRVEPRIRFQTTRSDPKPKGER